MNAGYKINKPTYSHINEGDSITVTPELKAALEQYESASEEPNLQNITERMGMAATVVCRLSDAAKSRSDHVGGATETVYNRPCRRVCGCE